MKPIPLEHVEAGRVKLLENARSFIAEADLLNMAALRARIHSPTSPARRLAKLPMYVRAGVEAELGHSVDWNALRVKSSSHTRKLDALHGLDYMFSEIRPDDSAVDDYFAALASTPKWNERKNSSSYVSISAESAFAPSDVIDSAAAQTIIAQVKRKFAFFEDAERAPQLTNANAVEALDAEYRHVLPS